MKPDRHYRPDIDGLRAIAVGAVVFHHAFPKAFKTGYIGVDIFFVISGFLISGIVMGELETQRFSITRFYARRILRIFPALLLVMVASYVIGWYSLFAGEFSALGQHLIAGALFLSNLQLWSEAGYFDAASEHKPLLHLWSLGIEEQFYIFWPLLLWLTWRRHLGFLGLTLAVALGSFAYNLIEVGAGHDTAVFYSPLTRVWELMLGGLLSWFNRHALHYVKFMGWMGRHKNALSVMGILLLVTGFMVLKGHHAYPGYRALLPVLGTVLLIAAGPDAWLNQRLLSSNSLVRLGLISYPLYLWHWPLLTYARIIQGEEISVTLRGVLLLLSLLLAFVTWQWLERPLRFQLSNQRRVIQALLLGMLLVAVTGSATWLQQGFPARPAAGLQPLLGEMTHRVALAPVDQSACQLFSSQQKHHEVQCILHDTLPELLILGDSHAGSFALALNERKVALNSLLLTSSGCLPFIDYVVRYPRARQSDWDCHALAQAALAALANWSTLKTVVLVNRGPVYFSGEDFREGPIHGAALYPVGEDRRLSGVAAENAFVDAYVQLVLKLQHLGKSVVFIIDWPELDFDPSACVPRLMAWQPPRHCAVSIQAVAARQSRYRELVQRIVAAAPGVRVYDSNPVFCDKAYCTAMGSEGLFYRDDDHLSVYGSLQVLADFIRSQGSDAIGHEHISPVSP